MHWKCSARVHLFDLLSTSSNNSVCLFSPEIAVLPASLSHLAAILRGSTSKSSSQNRSLPLVRTSKRTTKERFTCVKNEHSKNYPSYSRPQMANNGIMWENWIPATPGLTEVSKNIHKNRRSSFPAEGSHCGLNEWNTAVIESLRPPWTYEFPIRVADGNNERHHTFQVHRSRGCFFAPVWSRTVVCHRVVFKVVSLQRSRTWSNGKEKMPKVLLT